MRTLAAVTQEMAEEQCWFVWCERGPDIVGRFHKRSYYPANDADGGSTLEAALFDVNDHADAFSGVCYVHESGQVVYFWRDGRATE